MPEGRDTSPQRELSSPAAYATVAEYRARQFSSPSLDDRTSELLAAASRVIDRSLNAMPGAFAPMSSRSLIFDGCGQNIMDLYGQDGNMCPLRAVEADGIKADYDLTGDYDASPYKWDFDDKFIWPGPRNALALGEPYRSLQLRPLSNTPMIIWPTWGGSVQITGDWGWPSVPPAIRELTIRVARQIADTHRGGAAGVAQAIDDGIPILTSDSNWRLWAKVEAEYSYGDLAALGV